MVVFFEPERWRRVRGRRAPYWGWKDPRTALTLPIWARIFPRPAGWTVVRNGVDVAIGTRRRTPRGGGCWGPGHCGGDLKLDSTPAVGEICFLCGRAEGIVPAERWLEMRYEAFCPSQRPTCASRGTAPATRSAPSPREFERPGPRIDPGRLDKRGPVHHHPHNQIPALVASPLMQELGYGFDLAE